MDKREVTIIRTINAMPYKLSSYPNKEQTMSVLVVDIPPQYGMLLSRKWTTIMGGSIQCDLSYATFQIDGKLVRINREPKSVYMIEQEIKDDMTCFVDTDVNAFRAEVLVLQKEKIKSPIVVEVELE